MTLIAELLADPDFRRFLRENHERTRQLKAKATEQAKQEKDTKR
jgi:acyl-CoA hydrolase